MNFISKVVIPNKEWIIEDHGQKIGSVAKLKKGYEFFRRGQKINFKVPLFAKSAKSKSQYCAGYYVIKFRKGWVKSFCPKLITLERYPFHGPYKTEIEMKAMLNTVNKI